jgi:hypothetical protein
MDLIIYPLLGTTSRRAMLKAKSRFGRTYAYRPRGNLLNRLSQQTGMPVEQVLSQIGRERQYFLGK